MLRNLFVVATLSFVAGCACRPPPPAVTPGEISIVYLEGDTTKTGPDGVYDFGQVPMEKTVTIQLEIRNTGRGTLFLESLERTSGDAAFRWDFTPAELRAGESVQIPAHFASPPDTRPSVAHEATLILRA